ncbi:MAG: hypothetical protein JG781_1251 [Peptococcaceae bacterium]|nr:hypothetical protein [Peptococcaceae bacterium]
MREVEVLIEFFPPYRESSGLNVKRVMIDGNATTIEDLLQVLLTDVQSLHKHILLQYPWQQQILIIKNNNPVKEGEIIKDKDHLYFLPPLIGG